MEEAERAMRAGLKQQDWKAWKLRYEEIYQRLLDWEKQGLAHLASQLAA